MKTRLYHKAKQQITITFTVLMLLCIASFAQAQDATDAPKEKLSLFNFNTKAVDAVNKQYTKLQADVEKQSQKMLERMQKKEAKLKKKLYAKDSIKAAQLFNGDIDQQYANLQNKLSGKLDSSIKHPMQQYIPGLDSLQTSLDFLQSGNTNLPSIPADKLEQYKALSGRIQELQGRMQEASDIQNFIRERERSLKAQLQNTGLAKELTSINKEVYYYQQRLSEYKEILNDKNKLKETLLNNVRNLPAFQKFWQRNSFLSQLFPMPQEGADPSAALAGLQTRAGISAQLTQRFGGGAPSGSPGGGGTVSGGGYMQQQMQNAQSQLNELKNKLSEKIGSLTGEGANSDMTQPDFSPNNQHTRSFLQRLEYGVNFQSQQGTSFLPATTNITATVGYKLSDTKTFGFGLGYRAGLGNGWKDIRITNEGISIRSFCDFKAKGSLWLSGGFEYNYIQSFSSLRSAYNKIDVWQRSALLGLTKKIKITPPAIGGKSKKTSESKIQLLYDFLWNQQEPRGQQLVFRVGWGF